jgi:hypothetical protein
MDGKSLDALIPYDGEAAKLLIFDEIYQVMDECTTGGYPEPALRYARFLREGGQLRGYALAHLLWELREHWRIFPTDDTFEDAVFKETGISGDTTYKYVKLWDDIFANPAVPENAKQHLIGLPVNTTYLLTSAARHNQIEDWEEVIDATDQQAVREIVRKAKGKPLLESLRLIYLLDRDGSLKVRKGNTHYRPIGWLILDSDDEIVNEALEDLNEKMNVVVR